MPVPAGLSLHQTATLDLRTCIRRNPSNLWTPTSQRSVEFGNSAAPENVIYAGQGPPPPSPMVVERFQQVISQLFQQVSGHILQLQRSTLPPASCLQGSCAGTKQWQCLALSAMLRAVPPPSAAHSAARRPCG